MSNERNGVGRVLVVLGLVLLCAGTAAAGGFWLARQSEQLIARELQAQRAALDRIDETLAGLSRRPHQAEIRCAASLEAIPHQRLQAALDLAAEKSLIHQSALAKAELDAQNEPTPENLNAFASGEQLLDSALATERWTETNAAMFRDVLDGVSGDQASALTRRLVVAINEGRLAVRTGGAPF